LEVSLYTNISYYHLSFDFRHESANAHLPGDGKSIAGCTLEIETVPTPIPGKGEVLIKVSAAPVNPSDYGGWYGSQSSAYPMPIVSSLNMSLYLCRIVYISYTNEICAYTVII